MHLSRSLWALTHKVGGCRRTWLLPLAAGICLILLTAGFWKLVDGVYEGETRRLDLTVLQAMRAARAGHPWLVEVMRDLSGLGSPVVLTLFTAVTVLYLALFSSRSRALMVAIAVGSGALVVGLFKAAFGRVRPDSDFAAIPVSGLSFPSGHASMSAVVFLTMGVLVAWTRSRWKERAFILIVAMLLAVLVGISRVLLGVHYVTDVLGGWAFGAAWAIAWWLMDRASLLGPLPLQDDAE
jgi:undecaprenyl-diphosphatase